MMSSGGKRGPYREYLRNTEIMPRRMRREVEEAIYREKELPKDSENLEDETTTDISFLQWSPGNSNRVAGG